MAEPEQRVACEHLVKIEFILSRPLTDSSKHELNNAFDSLNVISQSQILNSEVIENLANLFVATIPYVHHEPLLSKFCHFLFNIKIQTVSFSKSCSKRLVEYLIGALSATRVWLASDILNALSTLLYENAGNLEQFLDALVGPAGVLLKHVVLDHHSTIDKQLAALKCIQNLSIRKPGEGYLTEEQLFGCFQTILTVLENQLLADIDPNLVLNCKVILTSLKGLKNVIHGWKNTPREYLGPLLGVLRVLMFYGLRSKSALSYCPLYTSPVCHFVGQLAPELEQNLNSGANKTVIQKKRTRKRRGKSQKEERASIDTREGNDELSDSSSSPSGYVSHQHSSSPLSSPGHMARPFSGSSSDSEFSDSEGNSATKLRAIQVKVRQAAYRTLQTVNWSLQKRVMFGYWSSFLPDIPGPSTALQGQTLLSSILKDPSPQVRTAALSFLTDLLDGSKLFLSIADESSQPRTSFIPMSVTLADVIKELHRSLLLALLAENSSSVLVQLLKCFSTLVDNVPYNRLKSGLLLTVLKQIQKLLLSKDIQVQVACLTLLGSVLSNHSAVEELAPVLFYVREGEEGWLISLCGHNLLTSEARKVPVPIQVETLQVLSAAVCNFLKYIRNHLPLLKSVIHSCLKDSDTSIQFHGAKVLEVFSKCALDERMQNKTGDVDLGEAHKKEMVDLWCEFLRGPLPLCLQHAQNHSLRALCCDALSTIGEDILPRFPQPLQILCVTLVLGLSSDEFTNVRGSAVRCLGIYAMYPCLQETSMFLLDVGEVVVRLLKDANFNTSLKASWAMGNLSAVLLQRPDTPDSQEDIPDAFLLALCSSAVKACKGQDKIRANAVRTLGNILRYVKPASLTGSEEMRSVVVESVQSLLSCCQGKSSTKAQWNACYALATLLQNEHLHKTQTLPMEDVFNCLVNLIRSSHNFKVQINAMAALVATEERLWYGNNYLDVWFCILRCFEVLQRPVDFKEVLHRDNLCEQICLSLTHLLKILNPEDICLLADFTLASEDLLHDVLQKVSISSSSQDKIKKIQDAQVHLSEVRTFIPESDILDRTFLDTMDRMLTRLLSSAAGHRDNVYRDNS